MCGCLIQKPIIDRHVKPSVKNVLRFFLLVVILLSWGHSPADQATVDAGVEYAKGLLENVQQLSTTTPVESIPAYGGTQLPQADYYQHQDLGGMQTDATVELTSGTANEAAQYGYARALQPKLQFADDDPLLLNAEGISTDAMQSPDALTVTTGNCGAETIHGADSRIEHCTAWVQPTHHVCNNSLQVDVTWEDLSSCPIGATFNQASTVHNYKGDDDITYARAYCNPGSGEDFVDIQVDASDGDPGDCTGWTAVTLPTDLPSETSTGAVLRPRFGTSGCAKVYVSALGSCVDTSCHYTLNFYQFSSWSFSDNGVECNSGWVMDLNSIGFTDAPVSNPSWGEGTLHCVYIKSSVTLDFEKPHLTKTPTVSENWIDGCGFLEAQVQ